MYIYTVQQSSLFGLSGMLPPRYTQASSVGMSLASVLSCVMRAVTKLSFDEERYGAIAFIVVGIIMILLGVVCQVIMWSSDFVKYHMKKAATGDPTSNYGGKKNEDIEMVSSLHDTSKSSDNSAVVAVDDTIELVTATEVEYSGGANESRLSKIKSLYIQVLS